MLIKELVGKFAPAAKAKQAKLIYDKKTPIREVALQANAVRQILAIFV